MVTKGQVKKKGDLKPKSVEPITKKLQPAAASMAATAKPSVEVDEGPVRPKETAKEREAREQRQEVLHKMLLGKRQEIIKEIEGSLGQSLTEDQQRRLESARDVGDQALMDLERELGISLMEMRNRRRQSIDEPMEFVRSVELKSARGGSKRFLLLNCAWSVNHVPSCWRKLNEKKIATRFLILSPAASSCTVFCL
jgi:DnaK suppressor protein